MSNSKFAIKRIKERENNPEIWDAAHELAEEWHSKVSKITFNDANWRVLNRNLPICTFERNWSEVFLNSLDIIKILIKEGKETQTYPFIAHMIYGCFATIKEMPNPDNIYWDDNGKMIVEETGTHQVPFIELNENEPFINIHLVTMLKKVFGQPLEAKEKFFDYCADLETLSGLESNRVWRSVESMIDAWNSN